MFTGAAEATALACPPEWRGQPRGTGGVPIRVDAAILDDPVVDSHREWEQYPARRADWLPRNASAGPISRPGWSASTKTRLSA